MFSFNMIKAKLWWIAFLFGIIFMWTGTLFLAFTPIDSALFAFGALLVSAAVVDFSYLAAAILIAAVWRRYNIRLSNPNDAIIGIIIILVILTISTIAVSFIIGILLVPLLYGLYAFI